MKIDTKRRLFSAQDRCRNCGSTKDLQVDHIIPKSKGGSDVIGNLQILCAQCNSKKKDRIIPSNSKGTLRGNLPNG